MDAGATAVQDARRPGWLWMDHAILIEHGAALGATGIAVYIGLASYANVDNRAWPGIRGLAKRVGLGVATVFRAIAKLEALGLITVERQHATPGDRETNRYVLVRGGCSAGGTGVPLGKQGVPLGKHGGVPLGKRNKNHSSEQEPKNNTTARARETDEDFDAFWTVYPKRVGKEAARRAWRATAKRRPLLATLLEAVHRARRSPQWLRDEGQFIPNPATWLNQGRWEDEPVAVGNAGQAALDEKRRLSDERVRLDQERYVRSLAERAGRTG